ncbi:MAG: type II secretion system protein [Patescibacteria group bacterium]|jgi:prepilin-type N-terminal cleavage/methylation domain-containing protein
MNKKCLWHRKSFLGFNLIEIVITVAVLAIIAGTIMYNEDPEKRIGQARDAQRIQELNTIARAIENYEIENHALPSDFSMATLGVGERIVLCSTAASLTCGTQTKNCLVVDDPNFLGKYLPTLPVDPNKSTATDTGYYVTRADNNSALVVGACDAYDTTKTSAVVVKATLPTYEPLIDPLVSCGNGILEAGEICDYNSAGSQCAYNADHYIQGIVYDPVICKNNPIGCSSSCNSCIKVCTVPPEPPIEEDPE